MVRSVMVEQYGGPEVLLLGERPALEPAADELLVETRVVGVNFIETYQREGLYPVEHPFTPGSEGMGVVIGVGAAVENVAIGDRVTTTQASRTYADAFLVKADQALRVPDRISDEVAAALPGQGLTAHYLVRSTYPAQRGDTAVITAAAGGVGGLAVQLLKVQQATVIAVVGSEEKAGTARSLGADHVIVGYSGYAEQVREITQGRGADVVYDSVGKDSFDESLNALRKRGMLVLFGASPGPVPPFDLQGLNKHGSLYVTRPTVDDYLQDVEERNWRASELFDAVLNGTLDVRIAGTYPLADAGRAHEALQTRTANGKLLLIP
ncbi:MULTISPECIES: quinone oxidoreductase [Arthrobacter]|uniref:Quinone oxidoreductase n=1 Tax=Arthrobacter terricola TaxID=2547396 RepID=A0A4R5K4N0_9MICC|nr:MULTISPECIES: quinone oxidoreductase [Arthrobacter]MBT8163789.1 quinone oxidoreductase [Arthrobacter sp. GN70]TDF86739.1 quinone oxidoreductase [Arthrobacter terricola]